MRWRSHVAVATGAAGVVLSEVGREIASTGVAWTVPLFFCLAGVTAAIAVAVIPDVLDALLIHAGAKHRNKFSHGLPSLWVPASATILVALLVSSLSPAAWVYLVVGCVIGSFSGWISHLLLDALNPTGIPLPRGRFSWEWANYDSVTGNWILCIFGLWLLAASVTVVIGPLCPLFIALGGIAWVGRWHSGRVQERDEYAEVANKANAEVVATLTAIAVCFQRRGEYPKAYSYRRAAKSVRELLHPLNNAKGNYSLQSIYGVGPAIAQVIRETLRTGHCSYLDHLRAFTPGLALKVPQSLLRKGAGTHEEERETIIAADVPQEIF